MPVWLLASMPIVLTSNRAIVLFKVNSSKMLKSFNLLKITNFNQNQFLSCYLILSFRQKIIATFFRSWYFSANISWTLIWVMNSSNFSTCLIRVLNIFHVTFLILILKQIMSCFQIEPFPLSLELKIRNGHVPQLVLESHSRTFQFPQSTFFRIQTGAHHVLALVWVSGFPEIKFI